MARCFNLIGKIFKVGFCICFCGLIILFAVILSSDTEQIRISDYIRGGDKW